MSASTETNVRVTITPAQIAELFWSMDSDVIGEIADRCDRGDFSRRRSHEPPPQLHRVELVDWVRDGRGGGAGGCAG